MLLLFYGWAFVLDRKAVSASKGRVQEGAPNLNPLLHFFFSSIPCTCNACYYYGFTIGLGLGLSSVYDLRGCCRMYSRRHRHRSPPDRRPSLSLSALAWARETESDSTHARERESASSVAAVGCILCPECNSL
uniref:Putative secreted protein n=1 Tax=Anopheles darlingi TaxID=43151 RepID=A0A2M4DIB8_ANODA